MVSSAVQLPASAASFSCFGAGFGISIGFSSRLEWGAIPAALARGPGTGASPPAEGVDPIGRIRESSAGRVDWSGTTARRQA
jgi:hypothetical protein